MAKPTIALLYDFDKTLSIKDQQEYTFIPSLGMEASEFWGEADRISKENNMDRILSYMFLMIKSAKDNNVPITKESFMKLGEEVVLLKGVKSWFKRINEYGKSLGVEVEHYILSSGVKEIIEGTPIAKYFKRIYACEFRYNKSGNADWPKQVINYTTKTQFIFRISKGAFDQLDDKTLNSVVDTEERYIPYRNMIYIGDGLTDVPCMKLVKMRGGEAVAIYHKDSLNVATRLLKDKRVGYICKADYSSGSELENVIKLIINQMALKSQLVDLHNEQVQKFLGESDEQ